MPSRGDREFAKEIRRSNVADERDVRASMAEIQKVEEQGRIQLLPEVMVARGILTQAEAANALARIEQAVMYCPSCGARAYAPADSSGESPCQWCGGRLKLRTVLLKVFAEGGLAGDSGYLQRALTEARVAARLDHPNVVRVFHAGQEEGQRYIEMELMEGFTLRQLLGEKGALPPEEAVRIVRQVALALGAAHREGLIHRHVKPENILIGADGVAKLTDFGLARFTGQNAGASMLDTTLEMAYSVPPEAVDGEMMDERSDIYSLGVTFYEMATGKPPFEGANGMQVMKMHCDARPQNPRLLNERISGAMAAVILKMLAKAPPKRFPGAMPLVGALDKIVSTTHRARLALLRGGNVRMVYTLPVEGGTICRGPGNSIVLCSEKAATPGGKTRPQSARRLIGDLFVVRPWGGLGQVAGRVREMIVDESGDGADGLVNGEHKMKRHVLKRGDMLRVERTVFLYLAPREPGQGESSGALGLMTGKTANGDEIKLAVGEQPILLGRGADADVRVQGEGVADYHLQIAGVAGRPQLTVLAMEPPRRVTLAGGHKVKLGSLRLTFQSGAGRRKPTTDMALPIQDVPSAMTETVADMPPQASAGELGGDMMQALQEEAERLGDTEPVGGVAGGRAGKAEQGTGACRITARTGPCAGSSFFIKKEPLVIGRSAECGVALMDGAVSRRHARLMRVGSETVVEDMGSSNGVFVNGQRTKRENLKPGDVVRIGGTEFLVHI